MSKPYRPCIVAVIQDESGLVLAGERSDRPGAWQLPQGGIDEGEEAEVALLRELREEIGTDQVRIVRRSGDWIRYNFPEAVERDIMKAYRGQEQLWFLLELLPAAQLDLALSEGEFQNLAWMSPRELTQGIIEWKRTAYRDGFAALGLAQ